MAIYVRLRSLTYALLCAILPCGSSLGAGLMGVLVILVQLFDVALLDIWRKILTDNKRPFFYEFFQTFVLVIVESIDIVET